MNRCVVALSALFLIVSLAGCADEGPAPEGPDETVDDAGADDGNATLDVQDDAPAADNVTVANAVPEVAFTADVLNGTVPFSVNLTINATDADGDALHWNLTRDGVGLAEGDALPAYHIVNFTTAGVHNFTVAVDDGNTTVVQNLTVVATQRLPFVVDIEDAAGDTETVDLEAADVTRLEAMVDGSKLKVFVTVVDLPTGSDAPSLMPWKYRLYVDGHQFQNFNYVGPDIWDTSNGEYIGGAAWDPDADLVSFSIDISRLEGLGLSAPFEIKLETGTGALSTMPHETIDWAPDSGTLLVG